MTETTSVGAQRASRDQRADLITVVVGAGPAGLLFALVGTLLHARDGGTTQWPILLVDKRASYERTHRLRIAPERYLALQSELKDGRFDQLIDFLEQCDFRPVVNALEQQLRALTDELGIPRTILTVGNGPGEVDLDGLRDFAIESVGAAPSTPVTVVAADSVHSTVRRLVDESGGRVRRSHQTVARFLVHGDGLPARLTTVGQYQMAKLVSSLIDYRLNSNGYAEVDVFLDGATVDDLNRFGSSPKHPVTLSREDIAALASPDLRHILEHFLDGLTPRSNKVQLQSTFELEHAFSARTAFLEDRGVTFLVGDAAISLPFFRGMAAMAGLVAALASAHVDLLLSWTDEHESETSEIRQLLAGPERVLRLGTKLLPGRILDARYTVLDGTTAAVLLHRWLGLYGVHAVARVDGRWKSVHRHAPLRRVAAAAEFEAVLDPARRYEWRGAVVRDEELRVVRARSRLIRGAREFARVSAMLPFPIQTWFLSVRTNQVESRRPSPLNLLLAGLAGLLAVAGPPLSLATPELIVLWWIALVVQAVGGFVYRASLSIDPAGQGTARRIWIGQIATVALVGTATAVLIRASGNGWVARSLVTWLLLGVSFIPGMYVFEALDRRWFAAARLE